MIAPLINLNIGKWKEGEGRGGWLLPALSVLLVAQVTIEPSRSFFLSQSLACDGALNVRALGTEHLIQ